MITLAGCKEQSVADGSDALPAPVSNQVAINSGTVDATGSDSRRHEPDKSEPTIHPALCNLPSFPSLPSVENIPLYLEKRTAVAHYDQEPALFATLPSAVKDELRLLLRVFTTAQSLTKPPQNFSVQAALRDCHILFHHPAGSLSSLRRRYDLWAKTRDWVSLVNRSKAGADWQARDAGLPDAFLDECAAQFGRFRRWDGKRQAVGVMRRWWKSGKNNQGELKPIPGYEQGWTLRNVEIVPSGWSYANILLQIRQRHKISAAAKALLHQGTKAAMPYVPSVLGDRSSLRFLERVEFDDVKTDFRIFDPQSGQVNDLWLLLARDRGTAMLLGFGMRPARVREDGSQDHLKLTDMKLLCGWILERYGLPPYQCTWVIERGTATLSEGSIASLNELLEGRIRISQNTMIGGKSPAGFKERGIGRSTAKASLESHNRLMHTMAADLPGQIGRRYDDRPQDTAARERESVDTWSLTKYLPDHLRGQASYSLLTLDQARTELLRIFDLQNHRTDHDLQGFRTVLEWWDGSAWMPQTTFPGPLTTDHGLRTAPQIRQRKESPMERCAWLLAPHREKWAQVSPHIITTFYEHSCKSRPIEPNGEITFTDAGREFIFQPPPSLSSLPSVKSVLCYFHPNDGKFLHVTDGSGRYVGCWRKRDRAGYHDQTALQEQIRYQAAALRAARDQAEKLAAPERRALDDARQKNAALFESFTALSSSTHSALCTHNSSLASALCSIPETKQSAAAEVAAAREAFLEAMR